MKTLLLLFIVALCLACCNKKNSATCNYKLSELFETDSLNIDLYIVDNNNLIEVRDKLKDSINNLGSLYNFDKTGQLRFYAFLNNNNTYKYSEEYDSLGNLIKSEGVPLVEYRLWKKSNDTIRFTLLLFTLNKKYENLEVITNNKDTIRPDYLYKDNLYTNTKCFSFELPVAKTVSNLQLYTSGVFINICTQEKKSFKDTISFNNIKL